MDTGTIEVNGATLAYTDTGPRTAPTVLFGHGLLFGGWMFARQIEALQRDYRCVTIDWRGQGDSPPATGGYDMDTLAADAIELIKALGLAPVHWVGVSMGGFVGLRVGARHGELLRSLTLLDTSAGPENRDKVRDYKLLALVQRVAGMRPVLSRVRPLLFGPAAPAAAIEEWTRRIVRADRGATRKAVHGVADRLPVLGEIPRITVPTLVVVGADDKATPPPESERIAAAIPGARMEVVVNCGHSCTLEQPAAVTGLLAGFLGPAERRSRMTATTYVFDPFADGYAEDPYPHYAQLRSAAPAYRHPLGFWLVSRYEDVAKLQRAPHSVEDRYLTDVPLWKRDSGVPLTDSRPMRGMSMLDQDPPSHTRLRRLVSQAFTRPAVEALEPRIEEFVGEALDRLAAAGRADVVSELAFPIPFTVISEMLGTPAIAHARLRELTGTLVRALEPLASPGLLAEIREANDELTDITRDLIDRKRAQPGEDLITALIEAKVDDDVLTEDELVAQIMFLYIAGHETTVGLLANGILALARHPAQAALLRDRPDLAAGAVEELLRYDTSVHLMRRITREPLLVQGEQIPAGCHVVACLASANRDPGFWGPDAGELHLDRHNAHQNVSFGAGIHHCLGAALARLEARIVLRRFVERFPDAEVNDVRWNGRINVRSPRVLTVSVR